MEIIEDLGASTGGLEIERGAIIYFLPDYILTCQEKYSFDMKKNYLDIDFDAVKRRIEKEMEGYSRTAWAEKVGVKINVVSNVHSTKGRQSPSLGYILAVSVATRKSVEYYLWGGDFYKPSTPPDLVVREKETHHDKRSQGVGRSIPKDPDPEMGKRIKFWRQDTGLDIPEVAKRSGLPVDLITRLEDGYHTTTDAIVKLANALRCSTDYILGCGSSSVSKPPKLDTIEKAIQ